MDWKKKRSVCPVSLWEPKLRKFPAKKLLGRQWLSKDQMLRSYCAQCLSCVWLCRHMDSSLPCSSVHGDSPGKNTGMGSHAFLQGIFPTQSLDWKDPFFFTVWATREAWWIHSCHEFGSTSKWVRISVSSTEWTKNKKVDLYSQNI